MLGRNHKFWIFETQNVFWTRGNITSTYCGKLKNIHKTILSLFFYYGTMMHTHGNDRQQF